MPKKSTAQPRPQLKVPPRGIGPVEHPNRNDVLCGRGGRINSHEGNVQFRSLVHQRKKIYLNPETKKLEKAHIAAKLVEDIRCMDPPGRFLLQDSNDGMWFDIGDAKAIKKVGQALREDAPEIREEFEEPPLQEQQDKPVVSPLSSGPSATTTTTTTTTQQHHDFTIREDAPAYHTIQGPFASQRFDFPMALQNIPTKFNNIQNRGLDALDLNSSTELPHYCFGRPYTSPYSSSASTNVSSLSGLTSVDEQKLRNSSSSGSNRMPLMDGKLRQSLKEAHEAAKNSLQSSALDAGHDGPLVVGAVDPSMMDSTTNTATTALQPMDLDPRGSILSTTMTDMDVRNSLRCSQIDVENIMRANSIHSIHADPGVLFQDFAHVDSETRNSMRMSGLGFDISTTSSDLTWSGGRLLEPNSSGVDHLESLLNTNSNDPNKASWLTQEDEEDMLDDLGPLRSRNQSSGTAMSLGTFNSSAGVQSTMSDLSQEMNVLGLDRGGNSEQD